MNAQAFRHFYDYHFAENRKLWDTYIVQLPHEEFTREAPHGHWSVRKQLVHLMDVDDVWFSELQGLEPSEELPVPEFDDREAMRARWDLIEKNMRAYLAALQDEMLFDRPIKEPEEDSSLITWQVLLHVANHGTDHRAQILQLLNNMGVKTSYQDYIFYVYGHPIEP